MAAKFLPNCGCQDVKAQARVMTYIEALRRAAGHEADMAARKEAWPNG